MYTDPRTVYHFTNSAGTTIEVEATAAICKKVGRLADIATAADADIDGIRCPCGADVEAFGVTITEAITNANATKFVISLMVAALEGATPAAVATLTLPGAAAEVVLADVRPTGKTAAQAVAVGARWLSADLDIPYRVPPGGYFYVQVTTAAGGAGGAVRPFVVVREPGMPDPTATSPVTRVAS